jgi:hypothetical protein
MKNADEPVPHRAGVDDLARRAGPDRRSPLPEKALRDRLDVDPRQVATDDQRRPRRIEATLVGGPETGGRQLLDGLAGAAGGAVVRRGGLVDRGCERLVGAAARIGLRLE